MPLLRRFTGPVPDLLSAEPAVRVDLAELRQALVFMFALGGEVETFDLILGRAALPPSDYDRAHFARDLFLEELVERMPVRVGARAYQPCARHLLRALAEPPRDPEIRALRRAVLEELAAEPRMRADLERAYAAIVELRTLLCAGRRVGAALRRLEILRAVHALFAQLAGSFEGARSALARVSAFGAAVVTSQAYERLDALLDHEGHLATVDVRVRVDADGELRTFQIVAVRENRDNPFHASPIGRLLARIRLALRGFRMSGGEVMERLYDDIFTGLEEPLALSFQLLADAELYLAALGLEDRAEARGLAVSFPDAPAGDEGMTFEGLWNPLLLGDKAAPVPCDLAIAHPGSVAIVTGPNSGGKTRLLQAIAIAQLMGDAGLFVPAAAARLPRVSGLFVSLVEEARADQPEGQLGMELLRIRRMFEQLGPGSLVMLDELCSGTNPSEGEQIAELVISLLPELGVSVFITTHLLSFAARLAAERPVPGLEFFQVALDARDRPTFGFVPGVARTSLAHKTAARLGVTREELSALIAAKKRAAKPEPAAKAPRRKDAKVKTA